MSLSALLLATAALMGLPQEGSADVVAVKAQFDRVAVDTLWPGFSPRTTPVAIYDGRATWLFGHPDPPEPFRRHSLNRDAWFMPGRHPEVLANTSIDLGGTRTATLILQNAGDGDVSAMAAVLLHETFHVYQSASHPDWFPNEADMFLYPFEDADLLGLRRLESEALRRSLVADAAAQRACWVAVAVDTRGARFGRLPEASATYERNAELAEGLAYYLQTRADADPPGMMFPRHGFAVDRVRQRAYASGAALAFNLDDQAPGWKESLERETRSLDALLAEAMAPRSGPPACGFSDDERAEIERRADDDVAELGRELEGLKDEFDATDGWRIIVVSRGEPLWPQGFDPLNVRRLSAAEVIHTRFVSLGNASGSMEVLNLKALTQAAGDHPLFNGVERVTVIGLGGEPTISEEGHVVRVESPGLTAEFDTARVERRGRTIVIEVGEDS